MKIINLQYTLKDFLFKSNCFLFHYLITIDDRFGLLVLISIVQIPNKFFQNLMKPLQCYTNWYARYAKSIYILDTATIYIYIKLYLHFWKVIPTKEKIFHGAYFPAARTGKGRHILTGAADLNIDTQSNFPYTGKCKK